MTSAKIDNVLRGLWTNFESAAAYLLPYDPVKKEQRNNNKRRATEIFHDNGDDTQLSAFGKNLGIGNIGVHLG